VPMDSLPGILAKWNGKNLVNPRLAKDSSLANANTG